MVGPAWVKNQDPDHISESFKNIFWVTLLKFFDVDLAGIHEENIGSWILDRKI
jgi:hypothetical protein